VTYVYKLENRETIWSLPVSRREIIYDNLPPGQYTLLLKGINADGVENVEPVSLKFRILPSVWETNLFMVLSILIILTLTILLTRYFIRRGQKLREEKLKVRTELSILQINAVLSELDPHFTFNAISSIGYLIMKERKEEAYTYLTRLSSLLRTILYDGSSICRTLAEELEFVRNYCELQILRFEGKFTYTITVDEKVDNQREIPKLAVQIFVENAIKHGFSTSVQGGKIDIILTQKTGFLEIIVRDNGIGRSASMKMKSEGTGHGIRTVNRIFEIMNNYNVSDATLEIKDISAVENLTGTEVILRIPDNYNFTLGS
jgi:sensor histidine kinase YesM